MVCSTIKEWFAPPSSLRPGNYGLEEESRIDQQNCCKVTPGSTSLTLKYDNQLQQPFNEGCASNEPPLPTRERPLQRLAKSHPGEDGMIDGTDNEIITILGSKKMETRKWKEKEKDKRKLESDEDRPVTQDEVQTDDNSKRDKQGTHILLAESRTI